MVLLLLTTQELVQTATKGNFTVVLAAQVILFATIRYAVIGKHVLDDLDLNRARDLSVEAAVLFLAVREAIGTKDKNREGEDGGNFLARQFVNVSIFGLATQLMFNAEMLSVYLHLLGYFLILRFSLTFSSAN